MELEALHSQVQSLEQLLSEHETERQEFMAESRNWSDKYAIIEAKLQQTIQSVGKHNEAEELMALEALKIVHDIQVWTKSDHKFSSTGLSWPRLVRPTC